MKLIKQKLYFSFLASVLFMALVSCGSQEGSIEIVYNLNNGSSAIVKSLDDSANIILPDDPLKTGYEFEGWYFDDEVFSLPFTKNSNLINIDNKKLHVFVKWKLIEYTMSFVTNCDLTIAPVAYDCIF